MIKEIIAICPHYINSLRYYDKLYPFLIKENIDVIYIFNKNREMEGYCKRKNRKYLILNYINNNLKTKIFNPFYRYYFKKQVITFIREYSPQLIIQTNDMHIYNDIIVKMAKKFKIMTLVLGWAVTGPEDIYFKKRKIKKLNLNKEKSNFQRIKAALSNNLMKIVHIPLNLFFNVHSNHKLSFGQGDSDIIAVFNNFTKNLIIKQGVSEKKIRVVGSLHYDDSINSLKKKSVLKLKEKYNININDIIITYFSQPFYTKDITILSINEQLQYLKTLINKIDNFYKKKAKNYIFILKLHPVEQLDDYNIFFKKDKIKIFTDLDNTDLILMSDICISQSSSVLQSVIIMKKPIISLNILGIKIIERGAQMLGIINCINTWEEFSDTLNYLDENNYSVLNNFDYSNIIIDGKCHERIIKLIKKMINLTKLKQR